MDFWKAIQKFETEITKCSPSERKTPLFNSVSELKIAVMHLHQEVQNLKNSADEKKN